METKNAKILATTYLISGEDKVADKAFSMGLSVEETRAMFPDLSNSSSEWQYIAIDLTQVIEAKAVKYVDDEGEILLAGVMYGNGTERVIDFDFDYFVEIWTQAKHNTDEIIYLKANEQTNE